MTRRLSPAKNIVGILSGSLINRAASVESRHSINARARQAAVPPRAVAKASGAGDDAISELDRARDGP